MITKQMNPVGDTDICISKDYFDDILGYDYVKDEMLKQLKFADYVESGAKWTEGFEAGIAFVGPKGNGKRLMAERYADAYADLYKQRYPEGKGCRIIQFRFDKPQSESEMSEVISWTEEQVKAMKGEYDKVALVISNVDLLTPKQVKDIQNIAHGVSDKVFTVVTMKNSDCVSAKELNTFDIKVCEPSESDSKAFLEYLINEKYKDVSFGTDMEGLLDIFHGRSFEAVDLLLRYCIINAASRNEDITPGMLLECVLGADEVSFRQYSLKDGIEFGVLLAGQVVFSAVHGDVSRGFAYLNGSKGNFYCNYDVTYNGNHDKEKLYVMLSRMAGCEICTGMKCTGSEESINSLKNIVIAGLTVSGIYGLEYLEFTGSEAQREKIDKKASEIMEEMYRDTIEMLSPYKELLLTIGEKLRIDGYMLLSEVKKLLREFDNNRE